MKRLSMVLLVCALASPIRAEVVTFEFEGTFTTADRAWFAVVGDSFSGTFSYDTSTPFSNTGIEVKNFPYPVITPPIGFSATIIRAINPTPIGLTAFSEPPFEVLRYDIRSTGPGTPETFFGSSTRVRSSDFTLNPIVQTISVSMNDNTGRMLGGTLSNLPSTLPPLSALTEATFYVGGGIGGSSLSGPLTKLVQVPEPATLTSMLVVAIGVVTSLAIRRARRYPTTCFDASTEPL